jgi:diguanylate cyclase (GGDEF)-like protein
LAITAAWAAGRLRERSATDAADTRLASPLRAATAEMRTELGDAASRARMLAADPRVQRAFAGGDRDALAQRANRERDATFVLPNGARVGAPEVTLERAVQVRSAQGRKLGTAVVGVPIDSALVERLSGAAGLADGDALAVERGDRFLTPVPTGGQRTMSTPLGSGSNLRLVVFTPEEAITEAAADIRRRVFFASLLTLAVIAVASWAVARLFSARMVEAAPARRHSDDLDAASPSRRAREAVALVGEALAATHDPEALLPVIVESAVGATGAVGARLVSDGTERVRAGDPESGGAPLSVPLGTGGEHVGSLLIYPSRERPFTEDEGRLAHWLAAQASIALENARLHRTVEQQAITDDLTGLANRRRFRESLGLEVSRAERFDGSLALVLADLDNFKFVNDLYGHQVGDDVLRRFADIMRESLREFDLAVRHGGEEFAVLLPETDLEGGARLAERLAESLRTTQFTNGAGEAFTVTSSFGVAAFSRAASAEQLMLTADRALYRAKKEGKNRVIRSE